MRRRPDKFQPADIEVLVGSGITVFTIFCIATWAMITYDHHRDPDLPNFAPALSFDPSLTPGPIVAEVIPSPTPSATMEVVGLSSGRGRSCIYSSTKINNAATPVPHGEKSEWLGLECRDGCWVVKIDVADGEGIWGNLDGIPEDVCLEYNPDGTIKNRTTKNLLGTPIVGPIH